MPLVAVLILGWGIWYFSAKWTGEVETHGAGPSSIGIEPGQSPSAGSSNAVAGRDQPGGSELRSTEPTEEQPDRFAPNAGDPHPPVDLKPIFEGRGTLRGIVMTPPGVPLPAEGTVVLGPAHFREGKALAAQLEVPFTAEHPEFIFENIPQAGYRVYAKAPGMNPQITELLLVKGSNEQYVMIRLGPAGFMDGQVVDEEDSPVEGLKITMVHLDFGEHMVAETDAAGLYRFPKVPDGEYHVFFGPLSSPLIPREFFTFKGQSFNYPTRRIPTTATVLFELVTADGDPLANALITGSGGESGGTRSPINVRTDARGAALVTFLPAGHYRISAEGPGGWKGRTSFRLRGNEVERPVEILCKQEQR